MATPAQIRANRENAKHSTGARTEAGKEVTRANALKHGLAAELLVLREDEDPAKFEALRAQLSQDYTPANETERMLCEEIAQCWFRLQRARAHETMVLDLGLETNTPYNPLFMNILRYGTAAQRGFHKAHQELRSVQAERRKLEPSAEAQPQAAEPEKVMAVGSVPQTDFEASPAPEPEPLTTNHQPLTTNKTRRPVDDLASRLERESQWSTQQLADLRQREAELGLGQR